MCTCLRERSCLVLGQKCNLSQRQETETDMTSITVYTMVVNVSLEAQRKHMPKGGKGLISQFLPNSRVKETNFETKP